MEETLYDILVPIFVCVVLPVAIVLIIALCKMNADNKRSKVLIHAIEANKSADVDKLIQSFQKQPKSSREIRNGRLLNGCKYALSGVVLAVAGMLSFFDRDMSELLVVLGGISLSVGISYLIVYYVTRKQIDEAE